MLILGLAFIAWSLYSRSVWLGHAIVLPFGVLLILAFLSDRKKHRRLRESQDYLATLACVTCDTEFGADAAHRAFNPPPPSEPMIVDDFGLSAIRCPTCDALHYYHRMNMQLELLSADPQPTQADA